MRYFRKPSLLEVTPLKTKVQSARQGWLSSSLFKTGKIYIMPTAYGAFFLGILFSMLIGAINNGSNSALLFCTLAIMTMMVAIFQTHHHLSRLKSLHYVHADPVHEGDTVLLHVHVIPSGQKTLRGMVLSYEDQEKAAHLKPHETNALTMNLSSRKRGVHRLDRLCFYTLQPMAIAKAWKWLAVDKEFVVYPRLEPNPPAPNGVAEGDQGENKKGWGEEFQGIRSYRQGDSMRDIAWKASAKSNQWLVKEREEPQTHERQLGWQEVSDLPYEAAISRLASWVVQAEQQGISWSLDLPDDSLPMNQGLQHMHRCLETLARMKTHE